MAGKVILQNSAPVTQSIEGVKALLAMVGRAADPLPTDVSLDNGRLVLVLNNKKDAYYTVTDSACSCPASTFRPGSRCKHQRKYFPADNPMRQSLAETLEQAERNLPRMPYRYRRMVQAAREAADAEGELMLDPERKPFKPFLED